MGRIVKKNTDIEAACFHVNDAMRLLTFNITKQRIVDICNKDFDEDPFEASKNYSSWHRALDGQEVWEGIVLALDGLLSTQTAHPKQYLPKDDPGEGLQSWMKQFAGAKWWHDVLQPDCSVNSLNGWFSGRSTTKDEVREKVDSWWARVQTAAEDAERYTAIEERDKNRDSSGDVITWDTWANDLLEDGVPMDEVRARFVEECLLIDFNNLRLIDLTDPQSPVYSSSRDDKYRALQRTMREEEFDALREAGFPRAISRTPPAFDLEPYFEVRQWGDRRNEECPKDLNTFLYGKWYRERCQRYWDATKRCVDVESEIVEVSSDGENWRDANEIEKKGWDNGILYFFKALHAGADTGNSYGRELEEAVRKETHLRRIVEGASDSDEKVKFGAKLKIAVRDLQIAKANMNGQYD